MGNPKVSVLVPVYGVERFIERCVVSLMEQTYWNMEFVFVDDATPDNSIAILESVVNRYSDRINQVRIIHHEVNNGLSAARNTAVAAATGDYIWHVDSDDYISLNAVERLVTVASSESADIVISDAYEVSEKGVKLLRAEYVNKVTYIKGLIQHTNICAHWNKFYRTQFYKNTMIQSLENIRLAEDYAVTPRLVHKANSIVVLHEPFYYYETTNQNSYVHNLSKTAITSQLDADKVLKHYFLNVVDSKTWSDVIHVLMQRSIVSLVKHSQSETWNLIREVYADYVNGCGDGMKPLDSCIFNLFKDRKYRQLSALLYIYRLLLKFK